MAPLIVEFPLLSNWLIPRKYYPETRARHCPDGRLRNATYARFLKDKTGSRAVFLLICEWESRVEE